MTMGVPITLPLTTQRSSWRTDGVFRHQRPRPRAGVTMESRPDQRPLMTRLALPGATVPRDVLDQWWSV